MSTKHKGKFGVRICPLPEGYRAEGQHVQVYYCDEDGVEHAVKNCTAVAIRVCGRRAPVELTLELQGPLEVDIAADIGATEIRADHDAPDPFDDMWMPEEDTPPFDDGSSFSPVGPDYHWSFKMPEDK